MTATLLRVSAAALLLVSAAAQLQWQRFSPTNPLTARYSASVISNTTTAVVTGGLDVNNALTGLLKYSRTDGVLSELPATDGATLPRARAAIVEVPVTAVPTSRYSAYSLCGYNAAGVDTNTVYGYDAYRGLWVPVTTTGGSPTARRGAAAVLLTSCGGTGTPCIVMVGGATAAGQLTTSVTWVLYFMEATPRWFAPTVSGVPPRALHGHAVAASPDGQSVYVFGGDPEAGGSGASAEVYQFHTYGFTDGLGSGGIASEMTNIARGKTATSSSNYNTLYLPAASVDGNTQGSVGTSPYCYHSLQSTQPWLRIDLGSYQRVDQIRYYPRTDCCTTRSTGFEVWFGNSSTAFNSAPNFKVPNPYTDALYVPTILRGATNAGWFGRYLWMTLNGNDRILQVCEFEAWQAKPWTWRKLSGLANVALFKPAIQSSMEASASFNYGDPSKCCNGNYGDTTRTDGAIAANVSPPPNIFLRVDLGKAYDIQYLKYWDGAGTNVERARNTIFTFGMSGDWKFNTDCFGPATSSFFSGRVLSDCNGKGRFVHVRKQPSTNSSSTGNGGWENMLMVSELEVWAPMLTDSPSGRTQMGFTTFGSQLVVFGGTDAGGFRLNEVRMFDMSRNEWQQLIKPLGTPPLGRALPAFSLLNPLTTQVNAAPSSTAIMFGGSGATDLANDFALLSFPACPILTMTNVDQLQCTAGNTLCRYTCLPFFLPATEVGTVWCTLQGTWSSPMPLCLPTSGAFPTAPTVTAVTPSADGTNATVTWIAPSSAGFAGSVLTYRVSTAPNDYVELFPGPSLSTDWTFRSGPPGNSLANVYSFTADGQLAIESQVSATCSFGAQNCPILWRRFPTTSNPALTVTGSWSLETRLSFDMFTSKSPQLDNVIGIGIFDAAKVVPVLSTTNTVLLFNTTSTTLNPNALQPGALEFYAGLQRAGTNGPNRVGMISLSAYTAPYSNWLNTAADASIGTSCSTCGGMASVFLRLDRDGTGKRWRIAYKYNSGDAWTVQNWQPEANFARNSTWTGGGTLTANPANWRIAFMTSGTGNGRSYGMVQYLRWSPLNCADPGEIREVAAEVRPGVPSPSSQTTVITGLLPGAPYLFRVEAASAYGYGTPSAAFGPITMPALPATSGWVQTDLIEVALNKPTRASSVYSFGNNSQVWLLTRTSPALSSPSYANDGTVDQPASPFNAPNSPWFHSGNSANQEGEWWQVDLLIPTAVKEMAVFGRVDSCCFSRLNNFEIYVGSNTRWQNAVRCDPSQIPTTITAASTAMFGPNVTQYAARFNCSWPTGLVGRYVTLHLPPNNFINLREAQIYASNSCRRPRSATNAVQVSGTNCAAGVPYGTACVHQCIQGYVPVGGQAAATCTGDDWSAPELVCAPVCPDLQPPGYGDGCMQSLVSEPFTVTNVSNPAAEWFNLGDATPDLGRAWFVEDNQLQANAALGCGSELHAALLATKVQEWRGGFIYQAAVYTADRAGLIWRAQDVYNMYRFWLDPVTDLHVFERVEKNVVTRLVETKYHITANTWYTVKVVVSSDKALSLYLNDVFMFTSSEGTFSTGYAGLYARTTAFFDDVRFDVSCNACELASGGDVCSFTCQDGLTATGPSSRTCVLNAAGTAASWFPSPSTSPLTCTLDPPYFPAAQLSVNENSPRNALVGDPLVATITSPDYQVQYSISGGNDNNTFYVDACSGQVKVRTPLLDYERQSSYRLEMRAFVSGGPVSETYQNITVRVLDVDEPPVITTTALYIAENSAAGALIGTVLYSDPENSAVFYTVVVDGSGAGWFTLDNSTGEMRVSAAGAAAQPGLDFESGTTSYRMVLRVTQRNDAKLFSEAAVTVNVLDVNDAPSIGAGQVLKIQESLIRTGAFPFGISPPSVVDQDNLANGNFSSALSYSLIAPGSYPPECLPVPPAVYPTRDGTSGATTLFTQTSATGVINLASPPGGSAFFSTMDPPIVAAGEIVRVIYGMCQRVDDGFSGTSVRPVQLAVVALVTAIPIVRGIGGATTMDTAGGELIIFTGTGFGTVASNYPVVVEGWSVTASRYVNLTDCAVTTDEVEITCTTPPGVGAAYQMVVKMNKGPGLRTVLSSADLTISYAAPTVTAVTGASGLITQGGSVVTFTGTNFGPQNDTTTRVSITFGPGGLLSCAPQTITPAALSHTTIKCTVSPGAGANWAWSLNVGGQVISANADGSQAISYAVPTISSVRNATVGVNLRALRTSGGDTLVVSGNNFGPDTTASGYSSPVSGTYGGLPFASCRHLAGAAAHTTLECVTSPGVGKDLGVILTVEGTSSPAYTAAGGLAYASPLISSVEGPAAYSADTVGGGVVYVVGANFGPVEATVPIPSQMDLAVEYGHPNNNGTALDTYTYKPVCRVSQADVRLECVLPPGVGAGHWWILNLGSQLSNLFPAGTSYGAPQVYSFSGAGSAGADTVGGQTVVISGRNFGPNDVHTNGLLAVSYGVRLEGGPVQSVRFVAAQCQLVGDGHTTMSCVTAEGAGKDLAWSVIVDSQLSQQPTTAYAPPLVNAIDLLDGTSGLSVGEADVNGGTVAILRGSFFGPVDYDNSGLALIQSVTFGTTGSEYVLSSAAITALSHTRIRVVLPPGSGSNLKFRVAVADQVSQPSSAVFSYALPVITLLAPSTSTTFSDPRFPTFLTLVTRNVPVLDRQSRMNVVFGNGATAINIQPLVPSGSIALAAATNADGTVNITFALPTHGAGLQRAVQLQVLPVSSSVPLSVSNVVLFSYLDPRVDQVVVTRARFLGDAGSAGNTDAIACPFPDNDAEWSCSDPRLYQIALYGSSFGTLNQLERPDGTQKLLDQLVANVSLTRDEFMEVYRSTLFVYSWTHTKIVAFAPYTSATLRMRILSSGPNGEALSQTLFRTFSQASPEIGSITGGTTGFVTTGGTLANAITLSVYQLSTDCNIEVTVGGRPATVLYAPFNSVTAMINSQLNTNGLGQPVEIQIVVPPGQGRDQPVQLTRINIQGDRDVSNAGFTVSYVPPTVTSIIAVDNGVEGAVVNAADLLGVVRAATDGTTRLRFLGSNLGVAPSVYIGDGKLVPAFNCTYPTPRPAHTCYEIVVPEGEGNGIGDAYPELGSFGYRVQLEAGNQLGPVTRFNYRAAVVTRVSSDADTDGLPTRGNVAIMLQGYNFGTHNPLRPIDSVVTVGFGRPDDTGGYLPCLNVNRISHYVINCTLPEGAGRALTARVYVAGVQGDSPAVLDYDPPVITAASVYPAAAITDENDGAAIAGLTASPLPVLSQLTLEGNTTGGNIIVLEGQNFGAHSPLACAFLTWSNRDNDATRSKKHACTGFEEFLGEGEVPATNVLYWDHERVVFRTQPGLGQKDLELSIRGNMLGFPRNDMRVIRFAYAKPEVSTLQPMLFNTEGGDVVVASGFNFGPVPLNTSRRELRPSGVVFADPVPLADAPSIPTAYLVISLHRSCVTGARDIFGLVPEMPVTTWYTGASSAPLTSCASTVLAQNQDSITFLSAPGIGRDRRMDVIVVDAPLAATPGVLGRVQSASDTFPFSYRAPLIQTFQPSVAYVGETGTAISVYGMYFGNAELADAQGWSADERAVAANVGGVDCIAVARRREISEDGVGETVLSCTVDNERMLAGYRNVTVRVAGQTGTKGIVPASRALLLVCAPGYYGHVNETCLPCPPVAGAICTGYMQLLDNFESRFTYPRPASGWYNLNSSDKWTVKSNWGTGMMSACPDGFQDHGRDVCIVPCDPPDSCLGDNHCKEGYASKAPMWRCASCDSGFYKRAGECIRCPDSPAALFIGFILLIVAAASIGFLLNKRQVNIAVISIGVDFFQVLAIFSQSKIQWPPAVKELMHVLSAFNLNIEIVAPECLIPDVSYKQKFWFIMILPLCVAFIFLIVHVSLGCYKAVVLGRSKKELWTHKPALVSSCLVLLYMLYLYLTRTIFDVFNCTPTYPPDGYTYLSVVFERCGVAGGTQVTLLPYAVAGLAVYTAGYPMFLGYKLYTSRELVMEDQLLRAKGVGNDRLSNPRAFNLRRTFGRSYFQFKPDLYAWVLVIIVRKLFIALTAVVFNKNASFQMAACLLVMFLAYALQVMYSPYMSPSEYEAVLKAHEQSAFSSAVHARLKAAIAGIESRGRKRVRRNLMNFEGKIDRAALLGVLSGWLFNYNTVEQIMSFAAVIVCLMGIMYQANELSSYYPESKDSVTAVVLAVIIGAILYFFTVFITEIVVLANEESRSKALAKAAKTKGAKGATGKDKEASDADAKARRASRNSGGEGEMNFGKIESVMNPLLMSPGARAGGPNTGSVNAGANTGVIDAILAQRTPPPPELWVIFQSSFAEMNGQLQALTEEKRQWARQAASGGASAAAAEDEQSAMAAKRLSKRKAEFNPSGVSGGNSGSASPGGTAAGGQRANPLSFAAARRSVASNSSRQE